MKKFFKYFVLVGVVTAFAFTLSINTADASTLTLSPASNSVAVSNTFTVNILLDTQGQVIYGVDVYSLHFNPAILQVVDADSAIAGVQISAGSLMTTNQYNLVNNTTGVIQFSQTPSTTGANYSGSGILATITFQVIAVGNSAVTFDFTAGSTVDTNVAGLSTDTLTSVTNASFTGQTPLPTISNLVGSNTTETSTTISWNTNIATNGQVSYGLTTGYGTLSSLVDNTTKTTSHSITLSSLTPSTTYNFKVTSVDASNNTTSSTNFTFTTLTPPLPPAPTITSFTATPSAITQGNSTTLAWSVSGATTVSINQGVGTVTGTSLTVTPTQPTTYTLTATNSGGSSTAQVTVNVSTPIVIATTTAPTIISFSSTPSSIISGGTSTLSWSVTGNPTPVVSISGGVGTVTGTTKTITPTQTTAYTLTATNSAGTATGQVSVNVTPLPVTPPTIPPTTGGGGGGSTPAPTFTPVSSGTGGAVVYIPPAPSSTTTPSSDIKQLELVLASLVKQVAKLQAELQAKLGSSKFSFPRKLYIGLKGEDVRQLQIILKTKGYLPSVLIPTTYFGSQTTSALQKFQCDKSIVCSGSKSSTGYGVLGPKTIKEILKQ